MASLRQATFYLNTADSCLCCYFDVHEMFFEAVEGVCLTHFYISSHQEAELLPEMYARGDCHAFPQPSSLNISFAMMVT